jgi:hypothetical protein
MRKQSVSVNRNGRTRVAHSVRIERDPNRQRIRAVCDLHAWESPWCAAGPGHPIDPDTGWEPPPALVERAARAGTLHLRTANTRRVQVT